MKKLFNQIFSFMFLKGVLFFNAKSKKQIIEELRNDLNSSNDLIKSYQRTCDELCRVRDVYWKQLETTGNEIKNLSEKLKSANNTIDNNVAELSDITIQLKNKNDDIKSLEKRIFELVASKNELEAHKRNLLTELETCKNNLSKKDQTLQGLLRDIAKCPNDINDLDLRVSYVPMLKNYPFPTNKSDYQVLNNQYSDNPEHDVVACVRVIWWEGQNDE